MHWVPSLSSHKHYFNKIITNLCFLDSYILNLKTLYNYTHFTYQIYTTVCKTNVKVSELIFQIDYLFYGNKSKTYIR